MNEVSGDYTSIQGMQYRGGEIKALQSTPESFDKLDEVLAAYEKLLKEDGG